MLANKLLYKYIQLNDHFDFELNQIDHHWSTLHAPTRRCINIPQYLRDLHRIPFIKGIASALCGRSEGPPLLLILVVVRAVEIPPVREVGAVVGGKVVGVVVGAPRGLRVQPPRLGRRARRVVSLTWRLRRRGRRGPWRLGRPRVRLVVLLRYRARFQVGTFCPESNLISRRQKQSLRFPPSLSSRHKTSICHGKGESADLRRTSLLGAPRPRMSV